MSATKKSKEETKGGSQAHTAMDEVTKGSFVRKESAFRNHVKADGSSEFPVEKGRYALYVSYACPWASRCLAGIQLLGLQDVFEVFITNAVFTRTRPDREEDKHAGWSFPPGDNGDEGTPQDPGATAETVFGGVRFVRDIYEQSGDTLGKYTVPILVDKKTKKIVNNESSEILRMMSKEFTKLAKNKDLDLYPDDLASKIEEVNAWVYPNINNGVYRAGFATTQEAYDIAVNELFQALDRAEEILSKSRYLVDNERLTEADIRLFVTLIRFDAVYHQHFKCNQKMISEDYPNLDNYMREIYQIPGMSSTVNIWHIRHHYFRSHPTINKYGIIPIGKELDFNAPHDRDKKFPRKNGSGKL